MKIQVINRATKSRKTYPLPVNRKVIIGRGSVDIAVDDESCSRYHALVFRDSNGLITVQDLDSRNGTYVNGNKIIDEVSVQVEDRIVVGNTELLVVGEPAPRPNGASLVFYRGLSDPAG